MYIKNEILDALKEKYYGEFKIRILSELHSEYQHFEQNKIVDDIIDEEFEKLHKLTKKCSNVTNLKSSGVFDSDSKYDILDLCTETNHKMFENKLSFLNNYEKMLAYSLDTNIKILSDTILANILIKQSKLNRSLFNLTDSDLNNTSILTKNKERIATHSMIYRLNSMFKIFIDIENMKKLGIQNLRHDESIESFNFKEHITNAVNPISLICNNHGNTQYSKFLLDFINDLVINMSNHNKSYKNSEYNFFEPSDGSETPPMFNCINSSEFCYEPKNVQKCSDKIFFVLSAIPFPSDIESVKFIDTINERVGFIAGDSFDIKNNSCTRRNFSIDSDDENNKSTYFSLRSYFPEINSLVFFHIVSGPNVNEEFINTINKSVFQ